MMFFRIEIQGGDLLIFAFLLVLAIFLFLSMIIPIIARCDVENNTAAAPRVNIYMKYSANSGTDPTAATTEIANTLLDRKVVWQEGGLLYLVSGDTCLTDHHQNVEAVSPATDVSAARSVVNEEREADKLVAVPVSEVRTITFVQVEGPPCDDDSDSLPLRQR